MRTVHPYLNFAGNTEAAFEHYRSIFGGEFVGVTRYGDLPDNPMGVAERDLDRIAHIALPLGEGSTLMGTDVVSGSTPFVVGNNVYVLLEVDSNEEAARLFGGLAAGGTTEMPLQRTLWAEQYGVCVDRFGVQWMVMYTGDVQFPA